MTESDTTQPRERSSIRFPYGDLEDAENVAATLHQNYGLSCSLDQLAAGLGQSVSGAFRAKVATAGTFGAIETGRGQVVLTDLGSRLADPRTAPDARAEAFVSVPLYQAVYEKFRGSRLPGDAGLEAEMVRLGVAAKQASKARQALQRSAEQAGFFRAGRDRLVEPAPVNIADVSAAVQTTAEPVIGAAAEAPRGPSHPLIVGLWGMLPEPGSGAFGPDEQAEWLEAAKLNLRLIYGKAQTLSARVVPSEPERPSGRSETAPPEPTP